MNDVVLVKEDLELLRQIALDGLDDTYYNMRTDSKKLRELCFKIGIGDLYVERFEEKVNR